MALEQLQTSGAIALAQTKRKNQKQKKQDRQSNGAKLGFEATLWAAADKLRGHLDAAEYKHVVLGLIFLKYVSDAFEERRASLHDESHADPEDRDEYLGENIFWVPYEARWSYLQGSAKLPEIGELLDEAMDAIEKENSSLKGILPKEYGKPTLDKRLLGELIDLVADVALGKKENRDRDVFGQVYEYFLGQFANAEGKKGGEFYTPPCVVRLLVEMLEPYRGRVYDPCCGSGGMFVHSQKLAEKLAEKLVQKLAPASKASEEEKQEPDLSVFGQESNPTTWKLCQMNLAIRRIDGNIGAGNADSFHRDMHPRLKADFILANPPFNDSDWGGDRLREDKRWKYGTPPESNANYAWVQHIIHHLAPKGMAGFVLANGSMSSNQSGEGEIRKAIIKADLVDCIVALPGQLFYNTQIPACLWFLARSKTGDAFRDRSGETLFIDARKLGVLVSRVHRELTDAEIARIVETYHRWRTDKGGENKSGAKGAGNYEDIPGFCKSANIAEIASHDYVLTPGRYVGAEEIEEDDEPFEEKMRRLTAELAEQFAHSAKLEAEIRQNLSNLGYGKELI